MGKVLEPYVPADSFPERLALMSRVIVAIILRETKTRFGRNQLGIIWALIEPIVYVGAFAVIRSVTRDAIPFGQDIALFLVSGLLTFRTFTALVSRSTSAIAANRALLAYPPVKPLDFIFARVILETIVMIFVWVVFLIILSMTADTQLIYHYDTFLIALCATFYLGLGIGVFNGTLSVVVPAWERIWSLLRLPLMLISALFFVPNLMPPWVQSIIYWNPVLHCVEWVRVGIYLTYDPMLSPFYVIGFSSIALCVGLALERGYRYKFTS